MPFDHDLAPLFSTADHGTQVFIDGVPLVGIFDRLDVDALETKGYNPVLHVQSADTPNVAEDSEVWIEGTRYGVTYIDNNGLGIYSLHLKLMDQPSGAGWGINFNLPIVIGPDTKKQNDHSLIYVSSTGLWHLHGITCPIADPGSKYISHYTSPDLRTWEHLDDITLGTGVDQNWRNIIFAPKTIANPGYGGSGALASYKWLKFFTGVNQVSTNCQEQKIGLAGYTDDDLASCTILNGDAPIYWSGMDDTANGGSYAGGAPWARYEDPWYNASRDCHPFTDGSNWFLALTSRQNGSSLMCVGMAEFSGGTDPDFLTPTHAANPIVDCADSGSSYCESATLTKINDLWYLAANMSGGTRMQDGSTAYMGDPWSGSVTAGTVINDKGNLPSGYYGRANEVEHIEDDVYLVSGHLVTASYYWYKINELDFAGLSAGEAPVETDQINTAGLVFSYEGTMDRSKRFSIIDSEGSAGAFYRQPVVGDQADAVDGTPSGMSGNAYIATHYERYMPPVTPGAYNDYTKIGALQSSTFRIRRDRMTVKVAGGDNRRLEFVALINADDGRLLFSETGTGDHVLTDRVWDLSDIQGLDVYLLIADMGVASMDCIDVDAARTYLSADEADAATASDPYAIGAGVKASVLLSKGGVS